MTKPINILLGLSYLILISAGYNFFYLGYGSLRIIGAIIGPALLGIVISHYVWSKDD